MYKDTVSNCFFALSNCEPNTDQIRRKYGAMPNGENLNNYSLRQNFISSYCLKSEALIILYHPFHHFNWLFVQAD